MKFCSECENMLYTKINQEDNSLQYNCKNCGFESKKKRLTKIVLYIQKIIMYQIYPVNIL